MAWNRSVSPTSPITVCTVPRETNASPPALRTFSSTSAMSASVASAFITTTIWNDLPIGVPVMSRFGWPGEARTPGLPARGPCPLAGYRRLRRAGPEVEEPVAVRALHVPAMVAARPPCGKQLGLATHDRDRAG